MDETKFGGVKGEAWRAAGVGASSGTLTLAACDFATALRTVDIGSTVLGCWARETAVVNFFTADGMAEFGKMNTDLVRAAGFEAALDERVAGACCTLTPALSQREKL